MRILVTFLVFIFFGTTAFCQTIEISGTVTNDAGKSIPYAFIRDSQHNYAAYADSAGGFTLRADPASALQVSATNYKETQVKIENQRSLKIILPASGTSDNASAVKSVKESINDEFLHARQQLIGGDASGVQVKAGFVQEATHGSRYLYNDWIPGYGINKNDGLVAELANMYNYDKATGNLMYSSDGRATSAVSADQVKTFTLYEKGKPHVYEPAQAIPDKKFVEVLLSTPKYKIYKKVDTKLQRADFHTDGVIEMGHRYDEYVDNEHYYFVGDDGKAKSISLKKSTLKKLMGNDADAFMAAQGSRDVDDDYVRDLGNSMAK